MSTADRGNVRPHFAPAGAAPDPTVDGMLRAVVGASADAIFVKDRQGRYLLLNEAAARIIGRPIAELLGQGDADFFPADDARPIRECEQRVMASGRSETQERVGTARGVPRTFRSMTAPYRDGNDRVAGVIEIVREITRDKQAEEALRERDERLRALVGALPDMIFRLGEDGVFLEYHGGAKEKPLLPPEDFLGKHYRDVMPPHVTEQVAAAVDRARGGGNLQTFDYEIALPGESPRCYEARLQMMPCGQVLVVCRDVTERRQAELALRASEARYRDLIEMAPDGIAIVREGRVAYVNRAAVRLVRAQSAEQVIGLAVNDYLHPNDLAASVERQALIGTRGQELPLHEVRMRRLDGTYLTVETCSGPCEFDGRPAVQVIVRDISERKRAEAALQRRLFELTALNRIGLICSEARSDDEVLHRATTVIGESLFPDNCGFLLLDPARGVLVPHVSFVLTNPHVTHTDVPLDTGIIGRTARSGRPQRVADVSRDLDYLAIDGRSQSELCVPIKSGAQVVGVANVESGDLDAFSAADEQLLGAIADLVGSALQRLRAEEALHASECRLRAIIEAEPECVKVVDLDGQLLEMNPAGLAMLGVQSLQEARQQPLLEYLLPQYRASLLNLHERVMGGESGQLEFEIADRLGVRRWLDTHAVPLRNENDEVVAVLGITRDVTERKKAEEQLRESEERYRSLVELAPDSILILHDDCISYCNPAGLELLGAESLAQVLGKSILDVLHPDDYEVSAGRIRSVLETGRPAPPRAFRVRRVDGSLTHIESRGGPCLFQGQRAVQVVARDITERLRAEDALRQSEQRYRLIAELSNSFSYQATITADLRISFHWIAGSFTEVTGYRPEELGGHGWFQLIPPEVLPAILELAGALQSSGGEISTDRELRIVARSGEVRWIRSVVHALSSSPPGEPLVFYGAVLNITDGKRAEEELAARQAELLHASRLSTVGQMVATLSHEVAQPLNAIGNFAAASGLLLDAAPARQWDTLKEYVQAIAYQSERCGAILRRLREFSRRATPRRTLCDLNELLCDAVELTAGEHRRQNVQVHFDLTEPLPPTLVDRVQLQQVVVNLLTNARDAVRDLDESRRIILVSSRVEDESLVFEIADRGAGLTPDVAQRLFEPFFTTKGSGMGIGLSICLSIVKDHGGRIEAHSNDAGGATFRVRLPLESRRIP